jgi:hypothetical protein
MRRARIDKRLKDLAHTAQERRKRINLSNLKTTVIQANKLKKKKEKCRRRRRRRRRRRWEEEDYRGKCNENEREYEVNVNRKEKLPQRGWSRGRETRARA